MLSRLRYLLARTRGLAHHVRMLHRGAVDRGHGPGFRRTLAGLVTGSISRFEHDLHHWAATVEGLDHPVMAGVEAESRGLAELQPPDPAFATSVVVVLPDGTGDTVGRCLESVLRQSRPAGRVVAACSVGESAQWSQRLPATVVLVETAPGEGGWRAALEVLETPFALLVDCADWLRPDLLYRYGLVQRLVRDPEATMIASAAVGTNTAGEVLGRPRTATSFRPTMPVLLATEWIDSAVLIPCSSWRSLAGRADPAAGVLGVVLELVASGLHLELVSVALRGRLDPDARLRVRSACRALALGRMLRAYAPSGLTVGADTRIEPLAPACSSLQVIVPFRDRADLTVASIDAVLKQKYPGPVAIVAVDNGSRSTDLARELERRGVQVVRVDEPFNYSHLNNVAAASRESELLLFLNNDVFLEQGALRALAEWAQVPEVGAVGAVLSYPDGRLQHAGIERDPHGPADELRWSLPERGLDPPQLVHARSTRVVDAVTGACMMMRRTVFEEVGGFDDVFYPNAFSDTDLCQRIAATGRVCVVTPRARGTHDESASRRYDRLEDFEGSAWLEERLRGHHRPQVERARCASPPGRPRRVHFGFDDLGPIGTPTVDVYVSTAKVDRHSAESWLGRGGLLAICVRGVNRAGEVLWSIGADRGDEHPARWFVPAGTLETSRRSVELHALVALSEDVDAVVNSPADVYRTASELERSVALGGVFARRAYAPQAADGVTPLAERRVVRLVQSEEPRPASTVPGQGDAFDRAARRYVCSHEVGEAPLPIAVRRVWYGLGPVNNSRPTMVVLAPFLAHGGAEHTLYEILRALGDRFRFVIATLVPHRQILGDRRTAFAEVADAVVSLGEVLEGDALVSAIEGLVAMTSAEAVYNANGSDPFYRFAAHLKARRPAVRVIDHLYDHVHGYISYYGQGEPAAVDICIAENHAIKRTLIDERGWQADRVRVVWPCGRRPEDLPADRDAAATRQRLRNELGIAADDVLFLTAARVHHQKRPLDLAALAERLADERRAVFVWVGGGELEGEFDRAIANLRAGRIRRLPFRSDVPDLILASDVCCLVSEYEGLPVFMLESLQLGRPFLSTDVGDVARVLEPFGAGLVAGPPADLAGLERAARRLCDPEVRLAAARRTAEAVARFAPTQVAAEYAEVLSAPIPTTPPAGKAGDGQGRDGTTG